MTGGTELALSQTHSHSHSLCPGCPFPLFDIGWKHSSSFSSFQHFRQAQTYQKNGVSIHGIQYSQQKKITDSSVSALLDDALNGRPQPQLSGDGIARTMTAPYPIIDCEKMSAAGLTCNSESKVVLLVGRLGVCLPYRSFSLLHLSPRQGQRASSRPVLSMVYLTS